MSDQRIFHPPTKTLVFSIAMNGYQLLYKHCLSSHQRYAKRCNYDYIAVTQPAYTMLGVECCWLKLTLIKQALLAGYTDVLFIDADAEVKNSAPALDTIKQIDKHLYLANGYSNRFNSGVIYARAHASVIDWLNRVLAAKDGGIPNEDDVGWGENGYVIHFAKQCEFIATLDSKWNNTWQPELADYIRHYNHGPLRSGLTLFLIHKGLGRLTRLIVKLKQKIHALDSANRCIANNQKDSAFSQLCQQVKRHYPIFYPER